MKLTALFTARGGHSFLAALSSKEGRNYQFDFLRPNHSLFGYFNRLVDQYSRIINPSKGALESISTRTDPKDRWRTLHAARQHAKWAKIREEQDRKRKDDQEAERSALFLALKITILIGSKLHSLKSTGTTMLSFRRSSLRQPMPTQNSLLP
jgi:splicing factor 3A subunit 1